MNTPLVWRLAAAGLLVALVVGVLGRAVEGARLGATDEDARARVEAELRRRFDDSADRLGVMASRIAASRDSIRAAARDPTAATHLFAVVDATLPDNEEGRTGITVYDPKAAPLAWTGRVTDLPAERVNGPATLFVVPGALGPSLVRVEPVVNRDRSPIVRDATIVVEQLLAGLEGVPGLADTFVISTSIAPVSVRARFEPTDDHQSTSSDHYTFVIPSRGGGLLVEAEVARADLTAARARARNMTRAGVLSVVALTLLLASAPLLNVRSRTRDTRAFVLSTTGVAAIVIVAGLIFWSAASPLVGGARPSTSPIYLLLISLAAAALAVLAVDIVERRRVAPPRPRLVAWDRDLTAAIRVGLAYMIAGFLGAWIVIAYEWLLQRVVSTTALDVLHFSLHPISSQRLAVAFSLILLHASVLWIAAALLRVPALYGRISRRWTARLAIAGAWLIGVALGGFLVPFTAPVPSAPLFIAVAATAACAAALAALHGRARRASQAARLIAVFLALVGPAVAMYPSLVAFATDAKERLMATDYGPQAVSQREDLKLRLMQTLDQIDGLSSLPAFVTVAADVSAPTTDRAFVVWSKTDLARYRLTSAIELYAKDGRLVSRFALNLPEYATSPHLATTCQWDLVEEVSPFGSSERHVLYASRGICERGVLRGSVVVRVMLDYRALPFISAQSPYLESLRRERQALPEGVQGRDIEFAVYGWSRAPIFTSGTKVWPLPDPIFSRLVESREPLWATITRDAADYRVYFLNDRGGIYALGYPLITWFGHLVNLAELAVLAGVLYVGLLAGATVFNAVTARAPGSGRALVREIRSSFYRKLFLAFWAGAVVPVVILAFATRAYFAAQADAGVEEASAKTATVAQRLVEDYATLQQRGAGALATIDDPIMVLVGRAIDSDVNLFEGTRLRATSERDLFESRLFSTRPPGAVYQRVMIERLPTFVGREQVGTFSYLVAAAPVRAGGREGIVTVPLPLRQQEIEEQIDELGRRVTFAAVLFSLFGLALGYWMAERIADPVNRLTRATRRIARGDLDAHIAASSADELGRLVRDFNRMAEDLKRQRAELERTQRLEAWADMARQVAHDIKNPLTPIQLSAEHARRVNVDRGRPLSPVLDECVNAILSQVALLRQISAEFSSFASSPTARPEPTRLPDLIREVVEPYRTGLSGRIDVEVAIPDDLPVVTIDRTLLARALANVIENALHAMPGEGRLDIAIHKTKAANRKSEIEDQILIEITDTGVGMDPESVARIFEPYFSTKARGTGLGLTIAKRNIELNGGTIEVTSRRGVGTTVTIRLPVREPSAT